MDWPIKLIALRAKVSQMATRASFVDSYAIGSAIRDKHLVIWRKNHCSDFQQTVRCKLRRWNESSGRKICFFQVQALRKRHRCSWFTFLPPGTVISRDETRVLTRNVEVALRIKCQVKRMIDARIHLGVALYEDLSKVVLSSLIERAVELQDLAVFEIRIDDIQILIRAKYESTKLTKLDARRKTLLI